MIKMNAHDEPYENALLEKKIEISTLIKRASGHERKRAPVKTLFATLIGSLFNV